MFAILYKSHGMVVKHEEISLAKMYEDVDLDRSALQSVTTKKYLECDAKICLYLLYVQLDLCVHTYGWLAAVAQ